MASDMDMTTAILQTSQSPPKLFFPYQSPSTALTYAEPLDAVPHFYAYIVKSTLLPIRKVQHELITLYFQHIHPMFPIVDEYRVSELHRKYRGHEELMTPSEFAVYHGVMVAGFAVSLFNFGSHVLYIWLRWCADMILDTASQRSTGPPHSVSLRA